MSEMSRNRNLQLGADNVCFWVAVKPMGMTEIGAKQSFKKRGESGWNGL